MDAGSWNEAELLARRAAELMRQRRYQAAREQLEAALELDPWNGPLHHQLGVVFDELGMVYSAAEAFRRAAEIDPRDVESLNRLAIDLHQLGRTSQAIETFESIERIDPTFEPAYCNRIHLFVEIGEHEKAEEVFYLGRLNEEHCPRCYFNIGCSLQARGLWARAAACLERALSLPELAPEAHRRLGDCFAELSKPAESARHYRSAISLDSGNLAALCGLAELLLNERRVSEASQRVEVALRLAADDARVQTLLGRVEFELGRFPSAVKALERAITIDPTTPAAHLTLARIAHEQGERKATLNHLRAELMLAPRSTATLASAAHLLLDIDERAQAAACFRRLLELDPADAAAWQNLGVAEALRGDLPEAIAAFERAVELRPDRPAGWHNLALALAESKRHRDARRVVREGLARCSNSRTLRILRTRLRLMRFKRFLLRPWRFLARL